MPDIEKKILFALAPPDEDGIVTLILGIPKGAWDHIKDGKTNTFDLTSVGLPLRMLVYGEKDHATVMRQIEGFMAEAGVPILDERRRDFSIKEPGRTNTLSNEQKIRTQMTEMVERAAQAMYESIGGGQGIYAAWLENEESGKENYRRMARAAIEAMREPSDDMLRQVERQYDGTDSYEMWCDLGFDESTINAWQAMIDSALSLPTDTPEGNETGNRDTKTPLRMTRGQEDSHDRPPRRHAPPGPRHRGCSHREVLRDRGRPRRRDISGDPGGTGAGGTQRKQAPRD